MKNVYNLECFFFKLSILIDFVNLVLYAYVKI